MASSVNSNCICLLLPRLSVVHISILVLVGSLCATNTAIASRVWKLFVVHSVIGHSSTPRQVSPANGTADAEIKVPSPEKPELSQVLSFKARSRSEYSRACFAGCHEFFFSNMYLPGSFNFVSPKLFTHNVTCDFNSVSDVYLWFEELCFALICPPRCSNWALTIKNHSSTNLCEASSSIRTVSENIVRE